VSGRPALAGRPLTSRPAGAFIGNAPRLALFRYIESFYNPLRRHSSLTMLSPNDYEARYWEDNTAAVAA